jgi:NADH:ubiquinone oxidoreductase subunit 6 (subunit J)
MEKIIIDIIGWVGTILFLVAYALVSAKKVEADSWSYQGMNLIAGIFLTINTLYLQAYPSAGLNIAWLLIAVITLGRRVLQKKSVVE